MKVYREVGATDHEMAEMDLALAGRNASAVGARIPVAAGAAS
jgi:hypothetical protein